MSAVPVRIGTPVGSLDGGQVFVVELSDAVHPKLYANLRDAEQSYHARLKSWRELLSKARSSRGDPIPRISLGADIDEFFKSLERDLQIRVTNQEQALTTQLRLSRADLDYLRRASRQLSVDDVKSNGLTWSQVMAITGIRDRSKLRECLRLIRMGRIASRAELREYRRRANHGQN